jgi:hypothetical protein
MTPFESARRPWKALRPRVARTYGRFAPCRKPARMTSRSTIEAHRRQAQPQSLRAQLQLIPDERSFKRPSEPRAAPRLAQLRSPLTSSAEADVPPRGRTPAPGWRSPRTPVGWRWTLALRRGGIGEHAPVLVDRRGDRRGRPAAPARRWSTLADWVCVAPTTANRRFSGVGGRARGDTHHAERGAPTRPGAVSSRPPGVARVDLLVLESAHAHLRRPRGKVSPLHTMSRWSHRRELPRVCAEVADAGTGGWYERPPEMRVREHQADASRRSRSPVRNRCQVPSRPGPGAAISPFHWLALRFRSLR